MIQKIGIVGLGALGIMYAELFQDALGKGHVYVIADRDRIQRYQKDGVYANGERCDFLYMDAGEAEEMDLLIFATKYHGLADAAGNAAKACGKDTIVLSVLNGVTSEEVLEQILHPAHLLYCTVQGMDATRTGNQLTYTRAGSIAFGEKENGRTEATARLEELFLQTGIPYVIPDDIIHQQWSKWMLNVGVNQVCAVCGISYGGVQQEGEHRDAMLAAMEEARQAACAEGIPLTTPEIREWVKLIDSLSPEGEPSMRQDTREGRPTEVDLFAGLVCSLGRKHGLDTPQNDHFYEVLTGHPFDGQ